MIAPPAPLSGALDPAFARVADRFAAMVAEGERGAVCVLAGGQVVLSVWGGAADMQTGRPWDARTIVSCFSVTKGIISLLAHRMIDRGELDPEAPVARYWPAFAAQGKGGVRVRDVLTHRAGLPAVSQTPRRGDLYSWARMTGLLAASAFVVPAGAGASPVYHNMTYGYLLGEILCHAAGVRPLSRLLRQELSRPLAADFHLGLGAAEVQRAAQVLQADPAALFRALAEAPETLFARSMAFFGRSEDFNSRRWRRAQIGSGSGHGTAEAVARLYGQYVWADALLSPARRRAVRQETGRSDGCDAVLGIPVRYGEGVELSAPPALDFGPNPATPGHWGAGGATGCADPDTGLAFGYVTAEMAPEMGSSPRARALVAALYDGI
jgi:CubicO group peptidase (beta-lactamase class C family)